MGWRGSPLSTNAFSQVPSSELMACILTPSGKQQVPLGAYLWQVQHL